MVSEKIFDILFVENLPLVLPWQKWHITVLSKTLSISMHMQSFEFKAINQPQVHVHNTHLNMALKKIRHP